VAHQKKYVDVDIFLYWLCSHPEHGERARLWIRSMESTEGGGFITSALTIYEVLVFLASLKSLSLKEKTLVLQAVEAILSLPELEVVPLTKGDCRNALEFMETYHLDYEDALHLAVALRCGATTIVSCDSDFDDAPIGRIF